MLKATIAIEGMMCPMCESHTNEAVKTVVPKCKVSSSHKDKETIVIAKNIDEEALRTAVEKEGYRVLNIKVEPYEKKGFFARLFKK